MADEPNVFDRNLEDRPLVEHRAIHSSDILPGTIKDRHISGIILQTGLEADLPDGSTSVKMYYETDTKKLKIWNTVNQAWEYVTLT